MSEQTDVKSILGIGNALTDILAILPDDSILHQFNLPKGSMQHVDAEAGNKIWEAIKDRGIKYVAGGSAANTISAAAIFGMKTGLIGKVGKDDDGAREQLEHLRSSLNHTQASLRAALWGLAEEAEGPEALTELFKYAAGRMPQWEGIVHFTLRGKERSVARQCSGALLLILQEAVGNAIRHGRATRVDVVVDFTEDSLVFGITDNGCGFEPRDCPETGHLGLDSIRHHAEGVGGTLTLKSVLGEGTTITVRIPL